MLNNGARSSDLIVSQFENMSWKHQLCFVWQCYLSLANDELDEKCNGVFTYRQQEKSIKPVQKPAEETENFLLFHADIFCDFK